MSTEGSSSSESSSSEQEEEEVKKMEESEEIETNESDEAVTNPILMGLFEDRILATQKARRQVESVLDILKSEEVIYNQYIEHEKFSPSLSLPKPSNAMLSQPLENDEKYEELKLRYNDLELKHQEEMSKRVKIQKAFLTFKTEGSNIIGRLRKALQELGGKHKHEKIKNVHLVKKLNDFLLQRCKMSDNEKIRKLDSLVNAGNLELDKYKQQFSKIENKFVEYKKMFLGHRKMMDQMKRKIERLQLENQNLRSQNII